MKFRIDSSRRRKRREKKIINKVDGFIGVITAFLIIRKEKMSTCQP